MRTHRSLVFPLLAATGLPLWLGSCSSVPSPITTSVTDLSFEARHFNGVVLKHSELASLGAQLPIPDVGMVYHYQAHPGFFAKLGSYLHTGSWPDNSTPPSTVVIISRDHSFRLVGEARGSGEEKLEEIETRTIAVRDVILRIRDLTSSAAEVTTRLALTRQELREETNRTPPVDSVVQSLTDALTKLADQKTDFDTRLATANTDLNAALAKPGVIVARWERKSERKASVEAGEYARASTRSTEDDRGLAILGGLRICALAIGDDFKQMIGQLNASDEEVIAKAAINTYLLQARCVSYISDRQLLDENDVGIKLTKDLLESSNPLDKLDAISIGYYAKTFQDLGNRGDIGAVTWSKTPYCFACGVDLPSLGDGSVLAASDSDTQEWITIVAQVVHPSLLGSMMPEYKKEWDAGLLPPHPGESGRGSCKMGRCDRYPALANPEYLAREARHESPEAVHATAASAPTASER